MYLWLPLLLLFKHRKLKQQLSQHHPELYARMLTQVRLESDNEWSI
jgi:hypothetical protein